MPSEQKLLWLYVLTGPYGNRIGLYRFEPMLAAVDTGIQPEQVETFLEDFSSRGLITRDKDNKLIRITNWLKSNGPINSQNGLGFLDDVLELPRSILVVAYLEEIQEGIKENPRVYKHFSEHASTLASHLDHRRPTGDA